MLLKSNPLVSVVITTYNCEKFVEECIESVQKQDYPNIEIIVMDDASTDNTVEIASRVLKRSKQNSTIKRNGANYGERVTSAYGFAMANGEYICRLSGDDAFVNSDHITKQVAEMEKYDLDWCYNSISRIGSAIEDSVVSQTPWVPIPVRYSAKFFHIFDNCFLQFPNVCYLIALRRNPVNSSALMVRRCVYEHSDIPKRLVAIEGLRSIWDGSLLGYMFLKKYKCKAIHSMGAFYRIHLDQATGKPETNKDLKRTLSELYDLAEHDTNPLWMCIVAKCMRYYYGL